MVRSEEALWALMWLQYVALKSDRVLEALKRRRRSKAELRLGDLSKYDFDVASLVKGAQRTAHELDLRAEERLGKVVDALHCGDALLAGSGLSADSW
eukprot:5054283-Prymnesium_polylepis.1